MNAPVVPVLKLPFALGEIVQLTLPLGNVAWFGSWIVSVQTAEAPIASVVAAQDMVVVAVCCTVSDADPLLVACVESPP